MQDGPVGFSQVTPIGKGMCATIYKAVHNETNEVVALKAFTTFDVLEEKDGFQREVSCHRNLEHPFIARYFGVTQAHARPCIVMEYTGTDSLLSLLETSGGVLEFTAEKIFGQLAAAVLYLHSKCHISHRDIKLENVMLTKDGNVKLIDFGVSRNSTDLMSTCCGSAPYCAPEIFRGGEYTKAVDIWACGVCLFTLLAGQLPFYNDNCALLMQSITNDDPDYPSHISEQALDLLKQMLEKDPKRRITIEGVVQHPWLQTSSFVDAVTARLFIEGGGPDFPEPASAEILHVMQTNGYEADVVARDLESGRDTPATMVYKILKLRRDSLQLMSVRTPRVVPGSVPKLSAPALVPESKARLPSLSGKPSYITKSPTTPFTGPTMRPRKFRLRSLSSAKGPVLLGGIWGQ